MNFIKTIFASAIGTLLAGIILLFFFFIMFVGLITASFDDLMSEKQVKVKEKTALYFDFSQPINERAPKDDIEIPGFTEKRNGLNEMLKTIEKAGEDEKIEGIYMKFGGINAGIATTEAIRNALLDFKKTGKWIIAYSETLSQKGYYLASVADELYLNPEGNIIFMGLSYKPMFMKDLLDKIGINMQVIRGSNNKFKSAVEPFMYNKMSDANKLQSKQLIGSIWNQIVDGISKERDIDPETINKAADELSLFFADRAREENFVDGLIYEDEIRDKLKEKLGLEKFDDKHIVEYADYRKVKLKKSKLTDFKKPKIAVVYAVGEIVTGEGDDEVIGSERISKAIREARTDTTVKAIVLRVNSPGGSALASDVIWREVTLAAAEKPFAVSMGDVAASGGYYISCASDFIFAEPNTITGSIGVFGVVPDMQELMNKKLGVYFDGVKTNEHADIMDVSKPLDEWEYKLIQKSVDQIYASFTRKVADGRDLRVTFVDSIGQGRVWTGEDALNIGLVDSIGGLENAIEWAAAQEGIEEYRIQELPKLKSPIEEFMKMISAEAENKIMEKTLDNYELTQQYKYMQSVLNMKGIQARLPYYISF